MDVPSSKFYVDTCGRLCGRPFSEERLRLVERYTAAWFDYYLRGDTDAHARIFGAGLRGDVQADRVQAQVATAPRALKAKVAGSEVHLTWPVYDVPSVAGYDIYREETKGPSEGQPLASVDRLGAYRDVTAVPGHTYYYALASYDLAGQQHGRAFAEPVKIPSRD
jgi:hypothetical protein